MTAAAEPLLRELAGRVLFEPLRPLLLRLGDGGVPDIGRLNRLLGACASAPVSGGGMPVHFVVPGGGGGGYEQRIFEHGEVETRAGNWHDFFNALAWLTFPHAKSALNARHYRHLGAPVGRGVRGPARDAATQFDECGVIVASADAALTEALRMHGWRHAFWERRADFLRRVRVFVFGHASYDQLRRPFLGLCGKALYRPAPEDWLEQESSVQVSEIDRWVANLFAADEAISRPKDLLPLPLLGVPGVVADNALAAYYDDLRQFRPKGGRAERACS